ncbi:GTP-binding protein RAD-like isoform X1 [Hylaeus anthracinus]|uniref:GTP-binding protein RAD-like isoform X1 n=1 Tax=Hylaeus anthracinus TaxID=313031 RepID=UPI0023B9B94C|nr:GTP-binding protein RAD-like isoform X1 [Hylaeus anthracinus]XP_054013722.1 GTP-binding protein RAD-like isoform X1 [Hylaeus anthracinus]XP_054013723.1 GTP-binding protein RAD-like isoform X1 [Hylaeus anthracinus]
METSALPGHDEAVQKNSTELLDRGFMNSCPPSSFPDKFQDFFAALNEDSDDLPSMLEDKLIPRQQDTPDFDSKGRRWSKKAFQRRSSEVEVRLHRTSLTGSQGHTTVDGSKSPTPSRRRSCSIAVARPTPDLHRRIMGSYLRQSIAQFLQAEAGPWGHLSPSPRSPTRTPAISPGAASTSSHLSPGTSSGGPSPTSPAGPAGSTSGSRAPGPRQYRGRTSSMPAVPRHRPMLVETKRGGAGGAEEGETEDGVEYYRLRSFSITANGVYNLGDSLKSRRSRSINSVTSSGTSCSSTKEARLRSSASQLSGMEAEEDTSNERVATYKVGMLGASGVGKTALTAQFTTSDYICAYDTSLDEEYGQKNVSVMLDGQETELEIIDHPAAEMSVETFCSTYNPDVYVVVYSVVDSRSLKVAQETLLYLWNSDYMASHGVILVGNKVDLERKREVPSVVGRRLANNCGCKFIETSSGIAHHVDELLVGILAQIKLNPQRDRDQATRRRRSKHRRRILKHLLGFKRKTKSCENLFVL